MGLLDTVADVASGVADVAPIPGSDLVSEGIDAAQSAFGGGGGNGGGQPPMPQGTPQTTGVSGGTPATPMLGSGGQVPQQSPPSDSTGFNIGGDVSVPGLGSAGGSFEFASQQQGQQPQQGQQQGNQMMQGSFPQMLLADLLEDAVQGSTSRAILEAMQSGSLQGGIIQQPVKVQTPRGVEYHSRPGFRTVTLNDQKVSVFKPVAKAMGLLPKGERTFREKADDAARDYLKMRRRWKDLASKFGFKSPKSRKSGPKR